MKVKDAMTSEVRMVSPAQTIRDAARLMAELDVGALPVAENDRLVGIVSFADLARTEAPTTVGRAVSHVSEPGGKHSQAAH